MLSMFVYNWHQSFLVFKALVFYDVRSLCITTIDNIPRQFYYRHVAQTIDGTHTSDNGKACNHPGADLYIRNIIQIMDLEYR